MNVDIVARKYPKCRSLSVPFWRIHRNRVARTRQPISVTITIIPIANSASVRPSCFLSVSKVFLGVEGETYPPIITSEEQSFCAIIARNTGTTS